jgi:5-methylcytosine-specific restriction protein A
MATYLFAWNPKLWPWPDLGALRSRCRRRGFVQFEWSSGRTKQLEPGSRAFLIRLGVPPKGIIGSGVTVSAPRSAIHWRPEKAALGRTTQYLDLRLETLRDVPAIGFDDLARPPFSRYRWGIRQSGAYLPEPLADALEDLWATRAVIVGPALSEAGAVSESGERKRASR